MSLFITITLIAIIFIIKGQLIRRMESTDNILKSFYAEYASNIGTMQIEIDNIKGDIISLEESIKVCLEGHISLIEVIRELGNMINSIENKINDIKDIGGDIKSNEDE